jgi:branched-chain amino acid transport system substrate-binding protein
MKTRILTSLLLGTAVSLWATGFAIAQDKTVKIGALSDQSGLYADLGGPGSTLAAQMAVEDSGMTAKGWKIDIISGDHQNKPDIGTAIARQWFDVEKVDIIVDVPNSGVALAVNNVVKEKNGVYINSGAATSDLTNAQCTPNTVHWTYDTYMLAHVTGQALVKAGGDSWFFLTADYAFGQALERDATKAVLASGGKVLGTVRHPFSTADFSSFLLQAQSSGAKILALANAGADFRNAIAQADEFNIRQSMQIVALQVTLTDVPALGLAHAHDLLFTDSFYWDRTPETRLFGNAFFKRHGAMPTAYQAGVNSSLRHYFKAVAATNSVDPETVIAQMRKMPVDDFFAQGGKVREDGRMVHDMYLMRIKKPEESKQKWDVYEYLATVAGDDAFRPMADGGCPYLAK